MILGFVNTWKIERGQIRHSLSIELSQLIPGLILICAINLRSKVCKASNLGFAKVRGHQFLT
ncbi:hypothetical protein PG5_32710 [Pseudomonas sp. G5(2012)]|nr:hypothetical protein PG5_32710 [Pseudomonas sp. G5(2012)]